MTDALAGAAPVPSCLARSLVAHALAAVVALGLVRAAPRPDLARTLVAFEMVIPRDEVRRARAAPAVERPPPAARVPSPVAPSPRAPRPMVADRPTPAAPAAPAAPAPPILTAPGGGESVAAAPAPAPAAPPSAAPTAPAEQGSAHAPSPPQGDPGPTLDVGAYLSGLTARVSRFRSYPAIAQEMGLEGTVVVRVVVRADGSLAAAPAVDATSGHEVLDDEALRIVARAAPFAPPLGHEGPLTLRVPVRFHLED